MTVGWPDFTELAQFYAGADPLILNDGQLLAPTITYLPEIGHTYQGLMVVVWPGVAATITVTIQDQFNRFPTWHGQKYTVSNVRPLAFVLPYPVTTLSQPEVFVTSSVDQTTSSNVSIFGLGSASPAIQGAKPLRSDGYDYPLGQEAATAALDNTDGPTTLVPAPGVGLALLLLSLQVSNEVADTLLQVAGTLNGVVSPLLVARGPWGGIPIVWPGGLKMDHDTGLVVSGLLNPLGEAVVIYDVIAVST